MSVTNSKRKNFVVINGKVATNASMPSDKQESFLRGPHTVALTSQTRYKAGGVNSSDDHKDE